MMTDGENQNSFQLALSDPDRNLMLSYCTNHFIEINSNPPDAICIKYADWLHGQNKDKT